MFSQTQFEREVVSKFVLLKLPIDSIHKIKPKDTLDKRRYNVYLKNKIDKKPIYILNGKRELEYEYFGILSTIGEHVAKFDKNEKPLPDLIFYDRAYPIGRVELQKEYYSLVVKVFSLMSTYYDIHNFSKEGKLLSVVPLYYFENERLMVEKERVIHVRSSITKEGNINWWEHYPGRTRERTYILNKDGFFEVITEKIEGK
jgi:hypothetical protein